MSPELTNLFMDIAGNTPFIGFLLYNWYDSKKREDRYQAKLEDQNTKYTDGLDKIRRESREEEEKLRERYQAVIKDLSQDRDNLMGLFDRKISELETKLESMNRSIRKIFAHLEDLKTVKNQVREIKLKEELKRELKDGKG